MSATWPVPEGDVDPFAERCGCYCCADASAPSYPPVLPGKAADDE